MQQTEQDFFRQLKNKIALTYGEFAKSQKSLEEWTQYDINNFQEHLEELVKDRVSEKWVYLHLKKENDKLPRIDVLNLLSRYVGFTSWDDFKNTHRLPPEEEIKKEEVKPEKLKPEEPKKEIKKPKNHFLKIAAALFIAGLALSLLMMQKDKCKKTVIIYKDAYTLKHIPAMQLEVSKTLMNKTSPLAPGDDVCLGEDDSLMLSVKGAYYKVKTFSLAGRDEKDTVFISLFPDDYALVLHYFSLSSANDWEKRRMQLGGIIHDGAKIFQVHESLNGLEILNKEEFIDRLTLPTQSLKEITIMEIEYKDEKIYRLRFKQDL